MDDRTIRPSTKTVWVAYVVAIILYGAAAWGYYNWFQDKPLWLLAIPIILFWGPVRMHVSRRLVTMRLHDDHLTLENGFFSRIRRTVDMAKIQDVTVRQTFGQRLLGTGDLMLESAGESGAMGISNVDSPRAIADLIIAGSKRANIARQGRIPGQAPTSEYING
jgi:uncharacterized membrane protein YdbT with pleckstrin-like domain